ncbi:SGNH/GDSL hydrolase family protein [Streptomyces sp. NPDC048057]|uniref:SGNH/GDSL hydrolase family protein n=1 Tax=Streptomyces sp. NPDC048057 TaxID=3155628 RepID=UPI0033FD86DB
MREKRTGRTGEPYEPATTTTTTPDPATGPATAVRRRSRTRTRTYALGLGAALLATGTLTACDDTTGAETKGAPAKKPAVVWDRSPGSIAAVGDSITRGFDACVVLSDCPEVSWATGTDAAVQSLALRLLGEPAAISQRTWNYARTGAKVAELPAQMARSAKHRPDLVTVLVGANDACADTAEEMTPVADFRASFTTALRDLRRAAPTTQVYVSSVPDLKRLWQTGRDNPLSRQIWKLGICASMLSEPQDVSAKAGARRTSVQNRVVAYNAVLKDVCGKDPRCRYDGGAVFDYRFDDEQLSRWDWFHPNKNGQGELAEIAYRNITAARAPR